MYCKTSRYSGNTAKKINSKRSSPTHCNYDDVKQHGENDDESHENCANDKYDVNEDNNDIVVHNFIVCNDN